MKKWHYVKFPEKMMSIQEKEIGIEFHIKSTKE
jgi:hypothetical protein